MTGKQDKSQKEKNPYFEQTIQRSLNKLISEEWFAFSTYDNFIKSVQLDQQNITADLFEYIANDEKDDHLKKLINVAIKYGYEYPSTYTEFKKYAGPEEVELFETFKSNKDVAYYLDLAIAAENRAILSYENALADDNLNTCFEVKQVFTSNYYDEVEHLQDLTFCKNVCANDSDVEVIPIQVQ